MDILHISDLHRSAQDDFSSLEGALEKLIDGRRFDFIVVSGDLSDKARSEEYADLLKFANNFLLSLLRKPEKPRIIFVPGNHDVSWDENVMDLRSINDLVAKKGRIKLDSELQEPRTSWLRRRVGDHGIDYYEVRPSDYPHRFKNIQKFLDDFYAGSLVGNHRHFNLTAHDNQGEDWSAHVFRDEGVAFIGLNSTFRNDRAWTGAAFSRAAIVKAKGHLTNIGAAHFLRIAVWHHGTRGEAMRPDYLELNELGQIFNAGFRVGFHGHTHKAEAQYFDHVFPGRIAVVSTGSLGAPSTDRPDAVGNQCSVVELASGLMEIKVANRDAQSGTWTWSKTRTLRFDADEMNPAPVSTCRRHVRSYTIDRHGIAEIRVELERLRPKGETVLALLRQPYCDAIDLNQAAEAGRVVHVDREDVAGQGVRFVLDAKKYEYETLEWTYHASNVVALDQQDVLLMDKFALTTPELPPGHGARPHTVRIACDELVLGYEFPGPDYIGKVVACVEKPSEGDRDGWQRSADEEKRCVLSTRTNGVELIVPHPRLGYRYSVDWELTRTGSGLDGPARRVLQDALGACLQSQGPESLGAELSGQVLKSLEQVLHGRPEHVTVLGMLWSSEQRRLVSAFGDFPTSQWSVRFASGTGVAGHAFRFASIAAWVHQDEGMRRRKESTIFQKCPEGVHFDTRTGWIACVPLLVDPETGPAIGVVSLQGSEHGGNNATKKLRKYAQEKLDEPATEEPTVDWLGTTVNSAFWTVLAQDATGSLGDDERATCMAIVERFDKRSRSADIPRDVDHK